MQISDPIIDGGPRPRMIILLIVGLALIVLAITAGAGLEQRARYQAEMEVRLRTLAIQRANVFSRTLENWRAQVRFLTLTPAIAGLARAAAGNGVDVQENTSEAALRRRLQSLFNGYLQAQPDVLRVSYLAVADRRLLVAVDNEDGQLETAERLQADLDEIDSATQLDAGSVHIDDLDPLRGAPGLEIPARPVLRLSAPVVGPGGAPVGVLVVTIDGRSLLGDLAADLNPIFHVYLTDAGGNFLLHPDPARSFGAARGHPWRWQDEFQPAPPAGENVPTKLFDGPDGRVHVARQQVMIGGAPGRYLTITVSVHDRLIADSADNVRLWVAGLGLSLTGLVGLLAMLGYQARRREQAIRARDAWLGALIHSARDAIIGLAPNGGVTSWNEAAARLFGVPAADAVGRTTQALIVPPGLEIQEQDMLVRVGQGDSVVNLRTRRRGADGRMIDVSITATPIKAGNRVAGIALVIRDVSEQLLAEAGLRAMAARLEQQVRERTMEIEALAAQRHAIMNGTGAAIIACDRSGTITLFNPAAEEMLGLHPQDVIGKATPALFLDPAGLTARAAALASETGAADLSTFDILVAGAGPDRADIRAWTCIRRDGRRLPVVAAITVSPDQEGAAICLIVMIPLPDAATQPVPQRDTPPPAPAMTPAAPIPGIDLGDAMGRVMGNRPLLDTILQQFADRFEGLGSDLRRLLATNDHVAAARRLHEFRGAAGNISARAALEVATALEDSLLDDPDRDQGDELDRLETMVTALCAAIRRQSRPTVSPVPQQEAGGGQLDLSALRDALRARRLTAFDELAAVDSALTARLGQPKFQELSRLVEALRYAEAMALLDAEFPVDR